MPQAESSPRPYAWWQRPYDGLTLTIVAMVSGVLLWEGMFPAFYYMVHLFIVPAWAIVLGTFIATRIALAIPFARATGRPIVWSGAAGVLGLAGVVMVSLLLKVPLHVGFAFAESDLNRTIAEEAEAGQDFHLSRSSYGLYGVLQLARRKCHDDQRIYFTHANDGEAAFVYSTNGIDDLCYNSGTKGHLSGNWYWIKED